MCRDQGLGAPEAALIAQLLEGNSSITRLDLWKNSIGDEGCVAIAKMLEVRARAASIMRHARRSMNATHIQTNTSLNELNLGFNNIGSRGAEELTRVLKV